MSREMFSLNKKNVKYNILNEQEMGLVELGLKLAQSSFMERSKKNAPKSDMLSSAKTDYISIFDSPFTNKNEHSTENARFSEKLVKYCMKFAGMNVDDFDIGMISDPMVNKNTAFREKFSTILAQVITPVIPSLISAEFSGLADVTNIAYGQTARYTVKSNDSFYVTHIAEGVLRGSIQRLYNNELTLNPEPYNVETAVDWYHVAAGIFDFGDFVTRIGMAFANYIALGVMNGVLDYVDAGIAAGSPWFVEGFTTPKFIEMVELLTAANGGRVFTLGTLSALSAILPEGDRVGMLGDLGREWTSVGHISRYMGVDLIQMRNILLPNTVNTRPLLGIPSDLLLLFSTGAYNPIKVVFEGAPVTIDIIPTEAPDKQMGVSVTSRMAQGLILGSRFGAFTGVTL